MQKTILFFLTIFNLSVLMNCTSIKNKTESEIDKIPVIYSPKYNIKLFGIQKLHPFDTEKPEKIHKYLINQFGFNNKQFYEAEIVSDKKLLEIHTKEYLSSLNNSKTIAEIAEMPALRFLPPNILKRKILRAVKFAVGGSLQGADVAVKQGFAINLSGGYHHAKANSGEGFCFFADINLVIERLKNKHNIKSVMIVDLDAHQGNGHESIAKDDSTVHIFDVYNKDIYPDDSEVKQYIDYNFPISKNTKDKEYLRIIKNELPAAVKRSKPDFIIYNAGTDIYKGDLIGMLSVSEAGIISRDEIVFKNAIDNKIPALMLLSGGYSKKSADITARSIENLLNTFYK